MYIIYFLIILFLILLLKKYYNKELFINKCLNKRDGVSGCRDCCKNLYKNKYDLCVNKCMNNRNYIVN